MHIDCSRRSPNCGPRRPAENAAIRFVVLHYTGMESAAAAVDRLCGPGAAVSAHYVIHEDGRVQRLVDEAQRAWHAGVGFWRGVRDMNSASIGIELVNPGHAFGYRPFPEAQIDSLIALLGPMLARHGLTAPAVIGHSDLAPGRKQDPGELFPWAALDAAGLALGPPAAPPPTSGGPLWQDLAVIGYAVPGGPGADILDPVTGPADVIAAFQRRFRPAQVDGRADADTVARAAWVAGRLTG